MTIVHGRGPEIFWDTPWDPRKNGGDPPPQAKALGLVKTPDADIVVINRPAKRWWVEVIPLLQQAGVRVVIDLDDRLDAIDDGNVARSTFDPKGPRGHWLNYEFLAESCKLADLVVASTPSIAGRFGFGHAVVLPNLVPERYLSIRPVDRLPASFGWTGTVDTHPRDLQEAADGLQRVLDATAWGFHVVGTGKGVRDALGLSEAVTASGWVPFDEYPHEMARITVGIVPLADTVFNRGKSALKMSEMAALCVPVVASPTPDNVRLNKLGIGRIANSPGQWRKHLRALAMNPGYREDMGQHGREVMAGQTYERLAERWWDAWATTLANGSRVAAAQEKLDRLLGGSVAAG